VTTASPGSCIIGVPVGPRMRERVAMLGGEFRAGARQNGGFAVFARLPIAGPAA